MCGVLQLAHDEVDMMMILIILLLVLLQGRCRYWKVEGELILGWSGGEKVGGVVGFYVL